MSSSPSPNLDLDLKPPSTIPMPMFRLFMVKRFAYVAFVDTVEYFPVKLSYDNGIASEVAPNILDCDLCIWDLVPQCGKEFEIDAFDVLFFLNAKNKKKLFVPRVHEEEYLRIRPKALLKVEHETYDDRSRIINFIQASYNEMANVAANDFNGKMRGEVDMMFRIADRYGYRVAKTENGIDPL